MNENGLVRGREVSRLLTCTRFVGRVDENWVFLVVDLDKILLVICARSVSLTRDSFIIGTRKLGFLFVICRRSVRYVDEKWGFLLE